MSLPQSAYDRVSGTVSEAAFMDTILQAAELYGWWHHHTYDSRRSTAGVPDLMLIKGHRIIYLEVKREKGRLTIAQADVLAMLENVGCCADCGAVTAAVVRPSDWQQIVEWLST